MPLPIQQTFDQALAHHKAGRLPEAEALYREVISRQPGHADAHQMLGILANQSGRAGEAVVLLQRAITLNPQSAGAHNNLGLVLTNLGQTDDAIAAFHKALNLQPNFPEALNNLGTVLRAKGQIKPAIASYQKALDLRPAYPEALNNLASALREDGRLAEAISTYRRALAHRPNYPEAWENLAHALRADRQFDEALAAFRQALALRPNSPGTLTILGNTLKELGLLDDAIEAYRQSLALRPDVRTSEDLLYALHFQDDNPRTMWEEHVRWNQTYALPLAPISAVHLNDRSTERRLRIGYVSPDFRAHCQAFFTVPLLLNHDHRDFEIFCYSNVERPDATTAQIQEYADQWRDVSKLTDAQAADLVRADQIDVLVDLTLHMDRSRPLLFARKPAPVQVTWLGYPGTTGMTAIDFRLSDPYLDPPSTSSVQATADDERFYSERTLQLPESFWCYDPLISGVNVNELPMLGNRFVTFGCLNNFSKITQRTLDLWAKVLIAVPDSRLILLAPPGSFRERLAGGLGLRGSDRIDFLDYQPRQKYLELYHQIDFCLDTVPCPGHTTTMDALWMGAPVVALPGRTAISRGGTSILTNAGLSDLIAKDADEYVRITLGLAHDLPRLQSLRMTLRPRLEASPLMDAPRFARNFEGALREMWRTWCATR